MIIGHKDHTKYLYHYTSIDKLENYIFKSRKLRFSPYASTNDPKESKDWAFSLHTSENRDLIKYTPDISKNFSSRIKHKARILCFCQDEAGLSGIHLDDIARRGFAKPRMWAQYGDNHAGACLVLNREKFKDYVENELVPGNLVISGPVHYHNRSHLLGPESQPYTIYIDLVEKHGWEQYTQWHVETFYKELFFEKMRDWSGEDEFRFLCYGDSNNDALIDITHSLVGIMFGASTAVSDVKKIRNLLKGMSVNTMGIDWKNCSPWYDFGNLEYS